MRVRAAVGSFMYVVLLTASATAKSKTSLDGDAEGSTANAPAASEAAAATSENIAVRLSTDNPNVVLYQLISQSVIVTGYGTGVGVTFRQVCRAPCNKLVPRDGQYFVGGAGVTGTNTFALPDGEGVTLNVKAGSAGMRMGGWWLATFGGVGVMTGSIFALVDSTGAFSPGLKYGLLGVGAAMLVGGIVMIATSGTSVTSSDGMVLAKVKTPVANFGLTRTGVLTF